MATFSIKDYSKHDDDVKRVCLKYYEWALDRNINSLRIVIADEFYYKKSLEERVNVLDTISTSFLCKTIVFQNTGYNQRFAGPHYPKYIAVMVQYIAKINTEKLNKQLKNHQNQRSQDKAGKQYFHYRLVEDKQSEQLTGYEHNGVVPVLMRTKMPIVFSHKIEELSPQFFWMGAGHPWIKMRCSFADFKRTYEDQFFIVYKYKYIIGMDYDDDDSGMFKVDQSVQINATEMVFFNKDTKIIADGQKRNVIRGQFEEEKKPLFEIISPYLHKFAAGTADLAAKAGSSTFEALKVGFLWVYNKFVDDVVPYAIQNLPKVLFVTRKNEGEACSGTFEVVGVQEKQYESINRSVREGKKRVVIPLGTQNDAHFEQFLKKQQYQISYEFPIDEDSQQQQCLAKESFMIPSESYEVICENVQQSHAQLQLPVPSSYKKKAYKLQNCFIFELQGQNTIEYDMLDCIEKGQPSPNTIENDMLRLIEQNKQTKIGYLVFPEQQIRKSRIHKKQETPESIKQLDPIGQLVQGVEEKTETIILEQEQAVEVPKKVDNERKVRVEISNKKRGEAELMLN